MANKYSTIQYKKCLNEYYPDNLILLRFCSLITNIFITNVMLKLAKNGANAK